MTDERTREHERQAASGDVEAATAGLRERMRAGELTQEHVELATSLGHDVARALCPDAVSMDWGTHHQRLEAIAAATRLKDKTLSVSVAADWAERALPSWEAEHPPNGAPRRAIAAARAWVACPCEAHGLLADDAIDTAGPVYDAAGLRTTLKGAACAAYAAADAAAAKTTDAAVFAAASASTAALPRRPQPRLVVSAAESARSLTLDAEREWQRLRLAVYVLGEL